MLQEDMKRAFMRGVCALNIEALAMMKRGGLQAVQDEFDSPNTVVTGPLVKEHVQYYEDVKPKRCVGHVFLCKNASVCLTTILRPLFPRVRRRPLGQGNRAYASMEQSHSSHHLCSNKMRLMGPGNAR